MRNFYRFWKNFFYDLSYTYIRFYNFTFTSGLVRSVFVVSSRFHWIQENQFEPIGFHFKHAPYRWWKFRHIRLILPLLSSFIIYSIKGIWNIRNKWTVFHLYFSATDLHELERILNLFLISESVFIFENSFFNFLLLNCFNFISIL